VVSIRLWDFCLKMRKSLSKVEMRTRVYTGRLSDAGSHSLLFHITLTARITNSRHIGSNNWGSVNLLELYALTIATQLVAMCILS
jgi:hypothetical protein